ncbi:hypothetical protein F2Q69_00033949 [Brassica cretica]|uniref:Mitochondrial import inner membrane translocase subunit n=1 Tax=Brassica cretica TaxID=69181 RepID=A0A8S9SI04_BRACR|nr:hypothetical protein F2Q69_00033949 [Brassica cretica]
MDPSAANNPELLRFLNEEQQRVMMNEAVAKLTSVCWDKCVTSAPGSKFSPILDHSQVKTTINVSVIASKVQQDTNEKTQDKPNVSLLQRSSAKQSLSSCGTEASTGAQLELIQNRFAPLLWS